MSNANDRFVRIRAFGDAKQRFRGMGLQPSLDPLLENWVRRLQHQIESGPGVQSTDAFGGGSLPVGLVVDELVAAYREAGPRINHPINPATTFPPLIGAVMADDNDAQAVMAVLLSRHP